jgi:hypothetical protein
MGSIKKPWPVKINVSLVFLSALSLSVTAQKTVLDSLHTLNDSRVLNVYALTNNIVYIGSVQPSFGYAKANLSNTSGQFKQPMQANKITGISMATGGYKKLNNWGYTGYFGYQKKYENKVSWSGVYDAYDDNPLIWADSSTGNWERDEVKALIGITAPTIAKIFVTGFQVDYSIGSGARLSNPKPFFRYRNIALQPGIAYQLPNKQELGFMGNIGFVKEENELGFYNTNGNNVLLYRLRGYGTFSKTPFVSGERKRVQADYGATLHYKKSWKKYDLLVTINASQRDDEISEGVALPVITGYFTGIEVGGLVSLYKGNNNKGKSITIKGSSKNGYVDDVIFRAESASSINQKIGLNASIWRLNNTTKSMWQYSFATNFGFIDNTDQATLMQFTASTIQAVGSLNYRREISKKIQSNANIDAGYNYVADDCFTSSRPNVITQALVQPNFIFSNTNYVIANAKIGIDILSAGKVAIHSVYLSTQNKLAAEINRTTIQLTYSILL